ncbi:uncharacterized protein BO95DRAFT_461009 [Aspergillus brunneoviolaceus CBS 621.78]|uniref:Uncharacterized protein n=1 Tax=Aspergillus brunneoviolaceus CBS 621.78 TaxID=1450534 RepID=A0ACD1GGP9_9EURO|nr:hypothetical protein BO95DRAFT_461009 [Aspergillus brunneoviolaceus CBS 621.78]RAH48417.1 hypothetical protein BO95DRAFT_461009 [Aspergillus brunneoviolaceus CBS 621.78]
MSYQLDQQPQPPGCIDNPRSEGCKFLRHNIPRTHRCYHVHVKQQQQQQQQITLHQSKPRQEADWIMQDR